MTADAPNHGRYMRAALALARQALDDGEFPVACVLVYRDRIVASASRKNSGRGGNELDHAEILALRQLIDRQPRFELNEVTVYSTMEPCVMCFSTLILSGIRTIVFGYEDVMGGGSSLDLKQLPPLFAAMEVGVTPGVLRCECLELFKRFFSDERHHYWRGSLLASYTLEQ